MFYFVNAHKYVVNAHKYGRKDIQMTFYPSEKQQMVDWMFEQSEDGWTVTFKEMNQNQEKK